MYENKKLYIIIILALLYLGCNDNSTSPDAANAVIQGTVQYLDGSPGSSAQLQLRKLSSNLLIYSNADQSGFYKFDSLESGEYRIRFNSINEDIHTYETIINLSESEAYEQEIYILYKKIDEFSALKKSTEAFLIKFDPDGGRIGNNFEHIDYLGGTFSGDMSNSYTLSSDIYVLPENIDWSGADSLFYPDYVRKNYTFITSVEEISYNGRHQIRFSGEDIGKILSNPAQGFIFIKNSGDERELMIPCVDFINNDFGLNIYYKE